MMNKKKMQKKVTGIVLAICAVVITMVRPVYALEKNVAVKGYGEAAKENFIDQIYSSIGQSDIIESDENIEIRFLDEDEVPSTENCTFVNSPQEVVDFLEAKEINMENASYEESVAQPQITDDFVDEVAANSSSKTVTEKKIFTRGIGILNINLSADITYDTSTYVISKVANRSLTITGVTIATKAENRKYNTYYSQTKKTCKVTCNYQDVSSLLTPLGTVEIVRKDAYQQFKWNHSNGIYGGEGGYGYADTSF